MSEVLAVNIPANPLIKVLSLPGVSELLSPISHYADNTSLVVCSEIAICAVFQTYDLYERGSGSKLNMSKSKGLWLGAWSGHLDPPVDLGFVGPSPACPDRQVCLFVPVSDFCSAPL